MPGADVASAFRELYAACGLPPPAVKLEADEAGYRATAAALDLDGPAGLGRGSLLELVAIVVFIVSSLAFIAVVSRFTSGMPPLVSPCADAVIALLCLTAVFLVAWAIEGGPSGTRLRSLRMGIGVMRLNATPPEMEAILASALAHSESPEALGPGERPRSLLDGCFRLGKARVLVPASDARRNALVGRGAGPGDPRVMRLAAAAAALVAEAVLLEGLVVALAPGAPGAPGLVGARRGRGSPQPPFPHGADQAVLQISIRALELPPPLAESMLRIAGLDAAVAAMGIWPVARDASGRLYRFRPDLAFVRVMDEVAGPDGAPLVHWISVPPHVLSACEGVAWSFGLPEGDYMPTAQS